jgi:cation transport ATPase
MNELSGTSSSAATTTKISSFVLLVVFITLALSLVALIFSVTIIGENNDAAWILLVLGLLGVAISTYVLVETRRRLSKLKIVVPPVTTTIECKKCGVKNVREFQRGDYIFKETEPCQKCNDKMLITAIYREVKEKEKERFPF